MTPFIMLVAAAAQAPGAAGTTATARLDAELQRLETGKWRPASLGGMKAVSRLFAPGFTTIEYGADFNGLVYRKEMGSFGGSAEGDQLAAALDATDFRFSEWKFIHPSAAVTILSYRVTAPRLSWTAYATSIWAKRRGEWRTVFYQASRAKPPAQP